MLRALISAPNRALSMEARALKSAGDMGAATPPSAAMRSLTACVPSTLLIARFRRVITSGGVPAGA